MYQILVIDPNYTQRFALTNRSENQTPAGVKGL